MATCHGGESQCDEVLGAWFAWARRARHKNPSVVDAGALHRCHRHEVFEATTPPYPWCIGSGARQCAPRSSRKIAEYFARKDGDHVAEIGGKRCDHRSAEENPLNHHRDGKFRPFSLGFKKDNFSKGCARSGVEKESPLARAH